VFLDGRGSPAGGGEPRSALVGTL